MLLETLAPEQFRDGHLPGAVNAPLDRVKQLAPTLVPNKQTEVITYCGGPKCHASIDAQPLVVSCRLQNRARHHGRVPVVIPHLFDQFLSVDVNVRDHRHVESRMNRSRGTDGVSLDGGAAQAG